MLNVVIVDDEKPALNLLNKLLTDRDDMRVVGAFMKPSELLKAMPELLPDVVFLDIEMPGINGLELASALQDIQGDVEIVFVTAYRQYALEAFQVNALDYLLKPVDAERFEQMIAKLMKQKNPPPKRNGVPAFVCFGGFEVYRSDRSEPVRFPTAKTEELLAFFLVNRETTLSKWTICESLWPGCEEEKAEQNLHTTVYRMKKTLLDSGIAVRLSSSRGVYRFEYDGECDYFRFERIMSRSDASGRFDPDEIGKGLRLYGGHLFESKDYIWCEAERERMYRQFVSKSKALAAACLQAGQYGRAIDALQNVIAKAPLDEEAREQLLKAYLDQGDRASFLLQYDKWEQLLKRELGLTPRAEISAMRERL